MSKGYYYTREDYIKKLGEENRFKDIYKRKMQDVGSSKAVTQPDITSLENLLNDRPKLKKIVLGELSKYMLSQDAERAVAYLDNNNQLENYIQTSNAFRKYIGNPILYKYSNFENSWITFNKSMPKMLPSSSPSLNKRIGDETIIRDMIAEEALKANENLVSEAIDTAYKIRGSEFLDKTGKSIEDTLRDEEGQREAIMKNMSSAERRLFDQQRKALREQYKSDTLLTKAQEKAEAKKLFDEFFPSLSAARQKELRRIADEGYLKSRLKPTNLKGKDDKSSVSFGITSDEHSLSADQSADRGELSLLQNYLEAVKTYGGSGAMKGGIKKDQIIAVLNKNLAIKLIPEITSVKDLEIPLINRISQLNISGSGLRKRKPTKTYTKILKGEIAAGNNNKKIKNKLKKIK